MGRYGSRLGQEHKDEYIIQVIGNTAVPGWSVYKFHLS